MILGAFRGDNSYDLLLLVHIFTAIVGFGAVFLNGIYGAQARARQGPEGLAIMQANFLVAKVAEYFIYAVAITGVLLVLISDDAWSFGDTWIWLAIVLYVGGLAISHGVLQPNVRRMIALVSELVALGPSPGAGGPPPQVAEMAERGKRVGMAATVLQLNLIVILYLMVFKPGA